MKFEDRDYFSDRSLLVDPYSYFDAMRALDPVYHIRDRDIMLVTGFDECREVLMNEDLYSAVTASPGPAIRLPFTPEGDDIAEQLEAHRSLIPSSDIVTSLDGKRHQRARGLLNKLFVPSRLKANEEYMKRLADRMASEVVAGGSCELIAEIATPFVTLVIADLLGVPADDREVFKKALADAPTLYDVDDPERGSSGGGAGGYLSMGHYFHGYITDRRASPRDDILTQISHATYPDGATPTVDELVRIIMVLFGAGQDTSAKLLANSVRFMCENDEYQTMLRDDPGLIPAFLEEMMRMEGSTKMTSRVALRKTVLGGVDIPAGQKVAVVLAGANRDPRRFDAPTEFRLKRPKAAEHLGFGRGAHTCIGAPLARAEVRIFIEKLLGKTRTIRFAAAHHGAPEDRRLNYEPSYGMRGLRELFVEFEPRD